ncbi:MAG: eukaryotic-like serine/threonine-protein kinase [Acidobacteriota bacterium]|jgi:hypothetical protein
MAIDDPVAFAPPPAFGPFRVLHQIGIGALGPVFRTYEPTRDRLVAVKVFRLDITPEQAQVLADELARASDAGLFHPSIVEPIAAGVEGSVAYRAEEYVAAESLDAAIRHYAPAPLDKTLPFLTQLAGAIDFARTAGIGHGALHLRDIFVTPEEARASGFGVVEALERVGLRAPVRRPYSAPERIAGEAWGTPADVFSLAAITYELLTGRRPSGTGDQMGPLTGDHLLEFGAGMRAVLARAMDEDPARRYPTGLAFASALEAAARGGRVTEAVTAVGAITEATAPGARTRVDVTEPSLTLAAAAALGATPAEAHDAADDLRLTALDRDLEEPDDDAIAMERDEDAAHYEVIHADREEQPRTLFDEEAEGDLAFERSDAAVAPGRLWEHEADPGREVSSARSGRDTGHYALSGSEDGSYSSGDSAAAESERPRTAVLPIAVTLILGLLVGFAAGFWAGGRDAANRTVVATAPSTSAPAPAAQTRAGDTGTPAAGTEAGKPAGREYSEQAVAQPPAIPPAVPDEGAPAARDERTRSSAATPTQGRILVTSTPSRAAVTVNGRWRGRTPLTLNALKFGSYNVRVILAGFGVAREDVALSASNPIRTVAVRLQRTGTAQPAAPARSATPARGAQTAPARQAPGGALTGSIYVDSRPSGARILLDGRLAGTTPARIPEISIGSHVVRLELAEHRPWTVSTRVAAGEETRVTGSLERIP